MYNPRFGTNLYQYLFEPNDSITLDDIKNEANVSLTYSFPNVQITKLDAVANEQTVLLSITANNTADLLNSTIFMEVLI
jgi:phage baseplate assembly protein W